MKNAFFFLFLILAYTSIAAAQITAIPTPAPFSPTKSFSSKATKFKP